MEFKEKLKGLTAKLKTIKNLEIIIAIVIIAVVALIYSSIGNKSCESTSSTSQSEVKLASTTSSETEIEERLAGILSEIKGAGKVDVMITYDSTAERVAAKTTNTHSTQTEGSATTSSSTTETVTPIIAEGDVIVLKEVAPNVKGVIVVAEGADDIKVRLELLRAVSTVLNIDANAIEIFAGNK